MALLASEIRSGGYVIDKATGVLKMTTNTVGSRWNGSNRIDPDGRLVIVRG